MKKFFAVAILGLAAALAASAQDAEVRLTVTGITPGGGTVYVAVYDSAQGFKTRTPLRTLSLDPGSATIRTELRLPPGEYVFSLYQDRNSNGKLDANFIGIPREPVGISRYDGKGPPGGFDKHKIRIGAEGGALEIKLMEIMG